MYSFDIGFASTDGLNGVRWPPLTERERAINAEESASLIWRVGVSDARLHEGRATYAVFTSAEKPQAL